MTEIHDDFEKQIVQSVNALSRSSSLMNHFTTQLRSLLITKRGGRKASWDVMEETDQYAGELDGFETFNTVIDYMETQIRDLQNKQEESGEE